MPTLLWARLDNVYVWVALIVTAGFGAIGFLDDYLKVGAAGIWGSRRARQDGGAAAGRRRSPARCCSGHSPLEPTLIFPFFKPLMLRLGMLYVPFVVFVLVGASNAVNLTDGLDGLAIGATLIAAAAYAVLTYVAGNAIAADYLQVPFVAGVGELTVFCGGLVGASLGFLWFNSYPAEMFMGDVGSLALGGAIGTVAILIKQELLLILVGGVFVLEALSVIIQVASFKLTGKRVFRMAPLHHHFELAGWAEPKIIIRFWILAIIFALVSIATLKLR